MKNALLLLRTCSRKRALNAKGKVGPCATTRSYAASSSSSSSGSGDEQKQSFQRHDVDVVRKEIASPRQIRLDHAYCVNLVRERDREGYRKSAASSSGSPLAHVTAVSPFSRAFPSTTSDLPDFAVCGLLMPSSSQKPYFAIRAFNVELASIKDGSNARRRSGSGGGSSSSGDGPGGLAAASSSIALQMRMQWWRDALATIYDDDKSGSPGSGSSPKSSFAQSLSVSCWHSPTVRSLFRAVNERSLTRRFLERMVDARESDLETNQPDTVQEMVDYAEETSSSLLYLALECAGIRDDASDATASAAGVGIGLTTSLRATPFRLLHGEVPLASELFPGRFDYREILRELEERNDEDKDDDATAARGSGGVTYDSESALVWQEAARHVAHEAMLHLRHAHESQRQVPRSGRACLLPVVPAVHYLSQLEAARHHVWHPSLLQPGPRSRLSLLTGMGRTWLTGVL
jgi:NADH dehydrogenase [ubiquinone] 1 alpha subcomplex assembly factor 6